VAQLAVLGEIGARYCQQQPRELQAQYLAELPEFASPNAALLTAWGPTEAFRSWLRVHVSGPALESFKRLPAILQGGGWKPRAEIEQAAYLDLTGRVLRPPEEGFTKGIVPWLRTIVCNKLKNRLKRERRLVYEKDPEPGDPEATPLSPWDDPEATLASPWDVTKVDRDTVVALGLTAALEGGRAPRPR
jgi:hypothetical protein